MTLGRFDLRRGAGGSARWVIPQRVAEGLDALGAVMKIGNRLVQARPGQVGQVAQKPPVGAAGLKSFPGRPRVIGDRGRVDVKISAPEMSLRVLVAIIGLAGVLFADWFRDVKGGAYLICRRSARSMSRIG